MIFLTFDELRKLVDFTDVDRQFVRDGFRLAQCGNGERYSHVWTTVDDMEKDCTNYALERGWDPETTLFLYDPPKTEEELEVIAEQTRKAIEEDPDWDDIQIGHVDPKQVNGSIYKDMTPERLAELLLKPWKLRVFS